MNKMMDALSLCVFENMGAVKGKWAQICDDSQQNDGAKYWKSTDGSCKNLRIPAMLAS